MFSDRTQDVSVALTVVNAVDTIEKVSSGEMSLGEAAVQVGKDAIVGATVGKGLAKGIEKGADLVKGARRTEVNAPAAKAKDGGSCSFHETTLVWTPDGPRMIGQIQTGDLVISGDPVNGALSTQSVLAQYWNDYAQTVYLTLADPNGGVGEVITSNTIHPFFVVFPEDQPRFVGHSSEGYIYEGPIKGGA